MANPKDIDRWKKGKDHWNKWAQGRLKAKEKLEKEGKWEVDDFGRGINAETKRWIASAKVDFSGHVFAEDADFIGFLFPHNVNVEQAEFKKDADFMLARVKGDARFGGARFEGHVWFFGARFERYASFFGARFERTASFDRARFEVTVWFSRTRFKEAARFNDAKFQGVARFNGASFVRDARFDKARFKGYAGFAECTFDGRTVFDDATFDADASFNSAKSDGSFSLADAKFEQVPDFIQMIFHAPARLDNLDIIQARPFQRKGDKEHAARYRALKKIAIESHDHVREQEFFASEVRERRGTDDPKWGPAWCFSLVYEAISNFGRSFVRPLVGLTALSIVFTFVYLLTRDLGAWLKCGPDGLIPMGKAAYLSFVNSMPFIGLGKAEQIQQVSNCLYGTAALPLGITIWTTVQTVLSTVLIFLFFLAIRNHFRIK